MYIKLWNLLQYRTQILWMRCVRIVSEDMIVIFAIELPIYINDYLIVVFHCQKLLICL